jgi:hypothetical protein
MMASFTWESLSQISRAALSASKMGIPRHEKIRQMVDLPDPIPPVIPMKVFRPVCIELLF